MNIATLLQSLDTDGDPDTNGISLPTTNLTSIPSDLDLNDQIAVQTAITNMGRSVRSESAVKEHLNKSIRSRELNDLVPGRYLAVSRASEVGLRYDPTCEPEFSSADITFTDTRVSGTVVGLNQTHNIDALLLAGEITTDTGMLLEVWQEYKNGGETAVLRIRQQNSLCHTWIWMNRENGINLSPFITSGATDAFPIDGNPLNTRWLRGNREDNVGNTGNITFPYSFYDPDGYITSATLDWETQTGEAGQIDLLAQSISNKHYSAGYDYALEAIPYPETRAPRRVDEVWYGYGISSIGAYQNSVFPLTYNQAPIKKLFGVLYIEELYLYECNWTLTYTVTDNEGLSFSRKVNWVRDTYPGSYQGPEFCGGGDSNPSNGPIVGVWDFSDTEDGLLDESYIVITGSEFIEYDYAGDDIEQGEDCYWEERYSLSALGNDLYRKTNEFGYADVSLSASGSNLVYGIEEINVTLLPSSRTSFTPLCN